MGPVKFPGQPGTTTGFHTQTPGSGDFPAKLTITNTVDDEEKEKKRIKKIKELMKLKKKGDGK